MENQSEFYYEKLKNSPTPSQVLLEFFREVTGREVGRSEVIMINKFLKLFGRFTVFFSIMDLTSIRNLEGNLYPLLYTICSRRFEKSHANETVAAFESLDKEIKTIKKQIEKNSKHKFTPPSSKGLE